MKTILACMILLATTADDAPAELTKWLEAKGRTTLPSPAPYKFTDDVKVDAYLRFGQETFTVISVIDDNTAVVEIGVDYKRTIWLVGIDASKLTDDEKIVLEDCVLITGTKKYKTAMGERTVLLGVFRPARWAKEK